MDRPSFVQNGAQKYNGARSSLSAWLSTPQGSYVLDWERAQFDSAVEDVFGFRAMQVSCTRGRLPANEPRSFAFSLALEPGRLSRPPLAAAARVAASTWWCALESHDHPHEVLRGTAC
jgi:hypothetical protein